MRNHALVSKHIFAGTTRIATKVEPGAPVGTNGTASAVAISDLDGSPPTYSVAATSSDEGLASDLDTRPSSQPEGLMDKVKGFFGLGQHPGQGTTRRAERANDVAQNVHKNPHLSGQLPNNPERTDPPGQAKDKTTPPGQDPGATPPGQEPDRQTGQRPRYDYGASFLYYYHPDHLGSTGYVTDDNGQLYEHIEYFPFGETWVEASRNTKLELPYRYTGKELDSETGLYYFGARYYDPRTSVWVSVDPILNSYLPSNAEPVRLLAPSISNEWQMAFDLPGMGGVFESKNLALYSYAHLNPLRYRDPDGREAARPAYAQIKQAYPRGFTNEQIIGAIGGRVADNLNSNSNLCATKVSLALNDSDNDITRALVPRDHEGRLQWSSGDDGNAYIPRVTALTDYLTNKYGAPDQVLTGDARDLNNLEGKGVVIFDMRGGGAGQGFTGHATLYEGNGETIDRTDYSDRSSRILFWKLPDE